VLQQTSKHNSACLRGIAKPQRFVSLKINANKEMDSEPNAMEVQGGSKKNKVAPRPAWTGYFVKLRDGELFEGFMVDGQRHGESRFTWADKDVMMCCWTKFRV